MKIVHLILAHTLPHQLVRLVEKLAHPNSVVYIHLDLKYNLKDFQIFTSYSNIHFIKKRVKVHWAGYSIVQATINSFQEIMNEGIEFDYLNLMSGQDYPIKKVEAFHEYLAKNPGKAFMEFYDIATEWTEAKPRLEKYFLANYSFPGLGSIEKLINLFLPKRKLPADFVLVGRSQWFTLAPKHINYILSYIQENPAIIKYFKITWGSDEIVFQSILFNSVFKIDMVNDNLRYIDWSERQAHPKDLTIADFDQLLQSNKYFARKFNTSIDYKIMDNLDEEMS